MDHLCSTCRFPCPDILVPRPSTPESMVCTILMLTDHVYNGPCTVQLILYTISGFLWSSVVLGGLTPGLGQSSLRTTSPRKAARNSSWKPTDLGCGCVAASSRNSLATIRQRYPNIETKWTQIMVVWLSK